MPKPTDVNSWMIFLAGDYNPSLFTKVKSQIHCVAREDDRSSDLLDVVNDVVAVIDNPDTGLRSIDFYDKATATVIGDIRIEQVIVRPQQPYATGISSVLVDIYARVKTGRSNRKG